MSIAQTIKNYTLWEFRVSRYLVLTRYG